MDELTNEEYVQKIKDNLDTLDPEEAWNRLHPKKLEIRTYDWLLLTQLTKTKIIAVNTS